MNDSYYSVSPYSRRERVCSKTVSSYLLMDVELPEYLRRIKKMLIIKDSGLPSAFSI